MVIDREKRERVAEAGTRGVRATVTSRPPTRFWIDPGAPLCAGPTEPENRARCPRRAGPRRCRLTRTATRTVTTRLTACGLVWAMTRNWVLELSGAVVNVKW